MRPRRSRADPAARPPTVPVATVVTAGRSACRITARSAKCGPGNTYSRRQPAPIWAGWGLPGRDSGWFRQRWSTARLEAAQYPPTDLPKRLFPRPGRRPGRAGQMCRQSSTGPRNQHARSSRVAFRGYPVAISYRLPMRTKHRTRRCHRSDRSTSTHPRHDLGRPSRPGRTQTRRTGRIPGADPRLRGSLWTTRPVRIHRRLRSRRTGTPTGHGSGPTSSRPVSDRPRAGTTSIQGEAVVVLIAALTAVRVRVARASAACGSTVP